MSWQVFKFGGTSLENPEKILNVKNILSTQTQNTAVVVSAMGGITNLLSDAIEEARRQNDSYKDLVNEVLKKHLECVDKLFARENQGLKDLIASDIGKLLEVLNVIKISKTASREHKEFIMGMGEVWSARLLDQLLGEEARFVDAREVLIISHGEIGPLVDWEESAKKLNSLKLDSKYLVITGFVASLANGVATTLGRNGSDFSASIFSNLLDASSLTIWTDVDGVYSADPNKVPDAVCLESLTYEEAFELSYFGAKVVHPNTLGPAIKKSIPIRIKNSGAPDKKGSLISKESADSENPVKGFSTIDDISLVNVEGTGMIGVPGIASRVFAALREVGVSVVLISQASSEHSICFAIPSDQSSKAKEALSQALFSELHHNKIQNIKIEPHCSILSAVGNNMANTPGIAASFFRALAQARVNVMAIAQGSSEKNISAVILSEDAMRGLQAVHSAFYLSDHTISLGVIGPGLIGSTLIEQIQKQRQTLKDNFRIDLQIRGIAGSKKMILSEGFADQWKSQYEESSQKTDLDAFLDHIQSDKTPHRILVDCTSSEEIGAKYLDWLEKGVHIVTPNKKANSGSFEYYKDLKTKKRAQYMYEATVGAGLPIISSLRDLVQTGDKILRIEGVFSGTLSYIFNQLATGKKFSEIVKLAKDSGFTEPDPRDDLSGMDVARKVVTLGREMGLTISLEDLEIESLVPEPLQKLESIEEFMVELPKYDDLIQQRVEKAQTQNAVLRYVGVVEANGKCSAKIMEYKCTHSFAGTQGSDNIIAFTTERYSSRPLVIQGPGAGPEVTATGVFSDILRVVENFGALR